MGIEATYHRFEDWLQAWPDAALTVVLLVLASILILSALRGSPLE